MPVVGCQEEPFHGPVLAGVHRIFPGQAEIPQEDLFDRQSRRGLGLGRQTLEIGRQVPFALEELHRQSAALLLVLGQFHLFFGGPPVLLRLFQGQL